MTIYNDKDLSRVASEAASDLPDEEYRSDFSRDFARVLHSPSFRRLTGKTQLFPNNETDFFRNRLTHSLEVAQIARSIANRLNHLYDINIDLDLVSFAAISHDIGHPPFGHQGEEALDDCMRNSGGFEGNAQTLRILTKIEKKLYDPECPSGIAPNGLDQRVGLNLTYRSIASILKYDNIIPPSKKEREAYHKAKSEDFRPVKGYYESEANLVRSIKAALAPNQSSFSTFKTIECYIMDIADDIAYSNYDLEDSFKAGFLSPIDMLYPDSSLLERVVTSVNNRGQCSVDADQVSEILISIYGDILRSTEEIEKIPFSSENRESLIYFYTGNAYQNSKNIASNGALRTQLTSRLVGKFIRGVALRLDEENPTLSVAFLKEEILAEVEVLKTFTYESQILSPKLKVAEIRGKEIIKRLFDTLTTDDNYQLLPQDYQELYSRMEKSGKKRIICDFIAGMTNKYAIKFYGRLTSENPETIFKPL